MMASYAFEASWVMLSVLVAFLSILASIILIMASKLFQSPKLEQTAKSEFIFAVSTLILVLFIIFVIDLATQASIIFVNELYGGGLIPTSATDITVIDVTIAYLNNVSGCAMDILNMLYKADVLVQMVLSIVMEVIMSELATGFFMNFFAERITNMTEILTFFLVIYHVIYHILIFLKHFGMVLFTFGVILRAFPPTRGAGAFVMAICLGLYFVFPLSYIVIGITMLETGGYVGCDISEIPAIDNCYDDADGVPHCTTGGTLSAKNLFKNSLNLDVSTSWISQFLDDVANFLNSYIMIMCFLPLLALTITMSFVLSTSGLFGATIPEVGKGLFKLI